MPCATAALGTALVAALATAAIPSAAVASAAIPAPAVASALSAAVASTVAASVPMRDLLEDLRIMRCRHLLMEPRHLEVRGALRKPPDLL